MKMPVSVIVLTCNEEKNIEDCLKSVADYAEELFIVDSFSTDNTIELSRQYTDRIYQHRFENYSAQRNWAQDNLPIKNEWIFHLDADERATPELLANLSRIFSRSKIDADAFLVSRRTIFRNRWIRFGGHYPVYHLRIYRKNSGRCEDRLYDQHFTSRGRILQVKGDIINIITPDLTQWQATHKKWAYLEAKEYLLSKDSKGKNTNALAAPIQKRKISRYKFYYKMPLFIRPFIYFFYRYIIKLGFLDGRQGLVFHFMHGFWYRFIVDMEIFNLRRKKCIS
jgi:glycosyltransferase involved in cell wall biosynthesis